MLLQRADEAPSVRSRDLLPVWGWRELVLLQRWNRGQLVLQAWQSDRQAVSDHLYQLVVTVHPGLERPTATVLLRSRRRASIDQACTLCIHRDIVIYSRRLEVRSQEGGQKCRCFAT